MFIVIFIFFVLFADRLKNISFILYFFILISILLFVYIISSSYHQRNMADHPCNH